MISIQQENELIDQVLAGKQEAYARLVDHYKSYAFTIALKILNNRPEAEEAAQDGFIKAFQNLKSFNRQARFSTWLYRIIFNTAISYKRKNRHVMENIEHHDRGSDSDESPLERHDKEAFIAQAMDHLNEADRLAIQLYYIREFSLEEVAEMTGQRVNTLKVRVHRARQRLADELTRILKTEALTSLGSFMNPKHKYTSSGVFTTKLVVDTNTGCSNSIMYDVFILPSGSTTDLSPINPYAVDFTMSTGGWIPEGLKISGPPNPLIISPISWRVDSLVNSTITSPTGMAWWTGKNKGTFFPSEQSALNGPCFNLSQLTRPMVALDYWSDGENNLDGAVLQYSTDGGLQWIVVGPPEGQVDRDEGINWYNGLGIPSNPGQQNTGNYGWTGKSTEWKNARFDLEMIPDSYRDQVRFRLAFSSNNVNVPGITFQGFALRSFFVGDKKRNVLVEHFTNLSSPESLVGDKYVDSLFQDQFNFRSVSDFHDIQYHVSFPSADSLNMDNPTDPAARSFFYGASQPPVTIMDGTIDGVDFKGHYSDLNRAEIDRRALVDPLFDLELSEKGTGSDNLIAVELKIKALADLNTPLIANVALIENQIGSFKNVMRKQLFQSDGETIQLSFNKGDILFKRSIDVKIDVPITNPNQLSLIGYIQNKNTKEIYQSVVIPASNKKGIIIVGLAESHAASNTSIFPNPAKGSFYLGIPADHSIHGFSWKLIDQRGITAQSGDMTEAVDGIKQIDVSMLPGGLYVVRVEGPSNFISYKKLVVIHGH